MECDTRHASHFDMSGWIRHDHGGQMCSTPLIWERPNDWLLCPALASTAILLNTLWEKAQCYISLWRLSQASGRRLHFSIVAIVLYVFNNWKWTFIKTMKSWDNTTWGNGLWLVGMINKGFCVLSLEENIFNYVFHSQGGSVLRVRLFNVTTMHY